MSYIIQIGVGLLGACFVIGGVIVQVEDYRTYRMLVPHPGVLMALLPGAAFLAAAVLGDWR